MLDPLVKVNPTVYDPPRDIEENFHKSVGLHKFEINAWSWDSQYISSDFRSVNMIQIGCSWKPGPDMKKTEKKILI